MEKTYKLVKEISDVIFNKRWSTKFSKDEFDDLSSDVFVTLLDNDKYKSFTDEKEKRLYIYGAIFNQAKKKYNQNKKIKLISIDEHNIQI